MKYIRQALLNVSHSFPRLYFISMANELKFLCAVNLLKSIQVDRVAELLYPNVLEPLHYVQVYLDVGLQ
jgi:hypothetical protein